MDKHHPPGTGPRPASVPAVPETTPDRVKDGWAWADEIRGARSIASLYLRCRIYNYLDWIGRPGSFLEVQQHLQNVTSKEHLEGAIADLEARGLLIRVETPSPTNPLLDPPVVRWRSFGGDDPYPDGAREFLDQCGKVLLQLEGGTDQ